MSDDDYTRQRRAELVEERKRELDGVVDRHDSTLRELFHLNKFVTLIGYDPHIAKQEKSDVWETFRKPYDLWDKHASVGPSARRTRRAITERKESLVSSAVPPTSTPKAASSSSTPKFPPTTPGPKGKPRASILALNPNTNEPGGKGKGKAPSYYVRIKKRPLEDGEQPQDEVEPDTPLKQKRNRKSISTPLPPPETPTTPASAQIPSESPTPLPKRIRLIVKPPPPPPIATHPDQLPRRTQAFGGSLEKLLASFALLEEPAEEEVDLPRVKPGQMMKPGEVEVRERGRPKVGITWDEFAKSVSDEVDIWARIRNMKREGGLGCMRGWEIVRGDEDSEEEEDVEEGEREEERAEAEVEPDAEGEPTVVQETQDSGPAPDEPGITTSPRPMDVDTPHLGGLMIPPTPGPSTPLVGSVPGTPAEQPVLDEPSSSLGLSGIESLQPALDILEAAPVPTESIPAPPDQEEPIDAEPSQTETAYGELPRLSSLPPEPTPPPPIPLPLPSHPSLAPSLHATLLSAIPAHARYVKEIPLAQRHRVATLITRYWDRKQGAAERLIVAEERRIRAGAKALAKGVVAKAWKDAVAVIRARIKEQEEAEQAREGRKHLAAILEQSSALLETQQEDLGLARRPGGRSRSASSGVSSRTSRKDLAEEEEENEEADEEGEGEGSDASGETELEVDEDGEEGEGGSEMLVELGSRGASEVRDREGDREEGDAMSTTADGPVVETDAMSVVEDTPARSRTGTPQLETPGVNGDDTDSTRPSSAMDVVANGHSRSNGTPVEVHTPKTNGHADVSSSVLASSGVRKLTLKLKEPEAEPYPVQTTRRSRRGTSTVNGADDSDSEVDGLAKDAEMPLEELMRRYGYVGVNEVQTGTPAETEGGDGTVGSTTMEERTVDSDDEDGEEDGDVAGALLGPEVGESPQPEGVVRPPFLLRGTLRPYQQAGLEWLVSGYVRGTNGILADEMGLGKTIQTISLLAHLACDRGIWGPHLIIVPTSVILNWEMEFKKFLPGFKVLSYYGSIKERKERRVGWNTEHVFNVVVTSYQLVLADQAIFRRKRWHYMILDEAHNIKNFKSQRWATLFSFNSERRLLLTGTPLQNNITELWSLLYFVQPDTANKQQFEEWFLETMRHAVETGDTMDEQTRDTIDKLHTVLRPYILRRLKADVERELPSKHEHIVYCRLSKRQRYLYDEFMSRAQTKETLAAGNFLSIVNCLMQLRKVCNHPDLFEVRPIVTSFAMPAGRSAVVDFEIKELLVRRRLLRQFDDDGFSIWNQSLDIGSNAAGSIIVAERRAALNASHLIPVVELPGEPPPKDLRTIAGNKRWLEYQRQLELSQRRQQIMHINTQRNTRTPIFGVERLALARLFAKPLLPADILEQQQPNWDTELMAGRLIKSYAQREQAMGDVIDRFAFATPPVVALDVPRLTFGLRALDPVPEPFQKINSSVLHRASVKLQIAFPDATLLQYDCGKLQELSALLRAKHAGGHRVLIFTQMTRVLDILEIFLNLHGYRYLRLDGSTKIEQRQVVTERFNVDDRIFAFIASSRSGGVGINLTGADTVIFYDSDYNPSMDRQCEDRAHRIGQTREVNIYRFISLHTVEESMLRKANQKRLLDDIVIQQGEFDWRQVLVDDVRMERALAEVEDRVDVDAARMAAGEEQQMDMGDFGGGAGAEEKDAEVEEEEDDDDGLRPIERYMLRVVEEDWEHFC
ncbi:DNA-dependent ATPase [Ceratobasidium sp. AG-Ba]|nr:DNA-dependent ATPase [Ceratobasidium sp. AG-Ba]